MVPAVGYRSDHALVGRRREQDILLSAMRRAASGTPATVLVTGDAGIGKTSLIDAVIRETDGTVLVARGTCLPLTSIAVPFLGLRTALAGLARAIEAGMVPDPPDLDVPPSRVPVVMDRWIEDVCRNRPLLLTIEDLHWADPGTLDALLYLVAAPATRAFTLVGTVRTGDGWVRGISDGWMAELRRRPNVRMLEMEPLDRAETAAQIADLLSGAPAQSLVEEVYARTRGHPYLTELTVAGLSPTAEHLAPAVSASVRSAALAAVRLAPASVRHLLDVLAVAGGAMRAGDLAAVLAAGGERSDEADTRALMATAAKAGIVAERDVHEYWFRHPLTAELIEAELPDQVRRRWHRVLAEFGQSTDPPGLNAALRIAAHWDLSGAEGPAYAAAHRAAELARQSRVFPEELRLRVRMLEWAPVDGDPRPRSELLRDARVAAERAGALNTEIALVSELLENDLDDLERAFLQFRLLRLRVIAQEGSLPRTELEDILRITERHPASWQHALVLSWWAETGNDYRFPVPAHLATTAREALRIARAAQHAGALASSWNTIAGIHLVSGDAEAAAAAADEAVSAALAAEDWVEFNNAAIIRALAEPRPSRRFTAAVLAEHRDVLVAHGAPHVYIAWLAACEACDWLLCGQWRRCQEALRFVITKDPGPYSDAWARITAARLAALQGRAEEASAHIAVVDGVAGTHERLRELPLDAVRSEVFLASSDPAAAERSAEAGIRRGKPPEMAEWLVPLAARALADRAEALRREGADPSAALEAIDRLQMRHPEPLAHEDVRPQEARLRHSAFALLYRGEIARCRHSSAESEAWSAAADAFATADLPWEQAYACLRAAQAMIRHAHGAARRAEVRTMIHRGCALADQLASPLAREFRLLAELAHVAMDDGLESVPPIDAQRQSAQITNPRLTTMSPREREVLALIAAGRTYAEIAAELYVSEKTVSAHVSHMLAKSGAANRVELALLVREAAPGAD